MKSKQIAKISLLFILLFLVAFSPIYLSAIHNERLINDPVFTKMQDGELDFQGSNNKENAFERLWVIVMANSKDDGIITEQKDISMETNTVNSIATLLEQEIASLGAQNILPTFTFSSEYNVEKIKRITFMNCNNPSEAVTIWDISIKYDDFYIQCWLDSETNTIYQIEILPTETAVNIDIDKINPLAFLHYLNIPDNSVTDFMEASNSKGYYTFKIEELVFHVDYRLKTDAVSYHLFFS